MRRLAIVFFALLIMLSLAIPAKAQLDREGNPGMTDGATRRKVAMEHKPDSVRLPNSKLEVELMGIWNEHYRPGVEAQGLYLYEHDGDVGAFGRVIAEGREGEYDFKVYGGPTFNVTKWLKLGVGLGIPDTCTFVGMGRIGTCKAYVTGFFEVGSKSYDYYFEGKARPHYYFAIGFVGTRHNGFGPTFSLIAPESISEIHWELKAKVLTYDALHPGFEKNEGEFFYLGVQAEF